MKTFFKENYLRILCVILLGLLFIFWGNVITREITLGAYTHNLNSTGARLACLQYYGWQVDENSETHRSVTIPDPLDAVWKSYNSLQTVCGFDLRQHQGKRAVCYTYAATNFPYQTDEIVYVNLLICDGTLIGGDCMTTALDGFMLPLDRRYLP